MFFCQHISMSWILIYQIGFQIASIFCFFKEKTGKKQNFLKPVPYTISIFSPPVNNCSGPSGFSKVYIQYESLPRSSFWSYITYFIIVCCPESKAGEIQQGDQYKLETISFCSLQIFPYGINNSQYWSICLNSASSSALCCPEKLRLAIVWNGKPK